MKKLLMLSILALSVTGCFTSKQEPPKYDAKEEWVGYATQTDANGKHVIPFNYSAGTSGPHATYDEVNRTLKDHCISKNKYCKVRALYGPGHPGCIWVFTDKMGKEIRVTTTETLPDGKTRFDAAYAESIKQKGEGNVVFCKVCRGMTAEELATHKPLCKGAH